MTIASVENSSVPLIPLNDLAESAAVPSGPAMWMARPCALACAMPRMESAALPAPFQPFLPRLTGTTVSIAWPSLATNGPATWLRTTPDTVVNLVASDAAFARSAAVSPDGRSYTTTAEYTLGDWNRDCMASTFVDCACGGSHDWASFFSAPVSLPASEPATARIRIHRTRTTHLPRRPPGKPTIVRALPIPILLRSAVLLALASNASTPDRHRAANFEVRLATARGHRPSLVTQTRPGPGTHRSAARHNPSANTLYRVEAPAQDISC